MNIKLEQLAKRNFELFSKNSGKFASWNFLNQERKLVWMKEVQIMISLVLEELKSGIKPVGANKLGDASYTMGYLAGIRSERMNISQSLHAIEEDIQQQIDKVLDIDKNKQRQQLIKKNT